jgi:hypothetical protein
MWPATRRARADWRGTPAFGSFGAGGSLEVFDYPGAGHLFTDHSLVGEYDPVGTELLWSRVLPFVGACG